MMRARLEMQAAMALVAGCMLCAMAGCGRQGSGAVSNEPAAPTAGAHSAPLAAGSATGLPGLAQLPFPVDRAGSGLTQHVLLGKDAAQQSTGATVQGATLLLNAKTGAGLQFAVYRFNCGGQLPSNVTVELDPASSFAGAYLGPANFTTGKWEFSVAFSLRSTLVTDGADYRSPDGNIWVAVCVQPGASITVDDLSVVTFVAQPTAVPHADATSGIAPLTVHFDGSASTDPGGTITQYAWDMDGDGGYDLYSPDPHAEHTFLDPGQYTVTLRVQDAGGAVDVAPLNVSVMRAPVGSPPTASFTFNPDSGPAPLSVHFDASASTDPDGPVSTYVWDWDGDGTFDTNNTGSTISHTFTTPGHFLVRLKVGDFDDNFNTTQSDAGVVVHGWSDIGPALDDSSANLAVSQSGSKTLIAYTPPTGGVRCIASLDNTAESWGAPQPVDTQAQPGPLALGMAGGLPALAYVSQQQLEFTQAMAADDSVWHSPQVVDTAAGGLALSLAQVNGRPSLAYYSGGVLRFSRASDASGGHWPAGLALTSGPGFNPVLVLPAGGPEVWYYDQTSGTISSTGAKDANGAAWNAPSALKPVGKAAAPPLAVVFNAAGKAGVCYWNPSSGQLCFTGWGYSTVLDSGLTAPVELSAVAFADRACIVYRKNSANTLYFIESQDDQGQLWNPRQPLVNGFGPALTVLTPSGGQTLGMAYETGGKLRFMKLF